MNLHLRFLFWVCDDLEIPVAMELPVRERKNMKTETYNGWTNYATWRVNLEIFDGDNDRWSHGSSDGMREFAELLIEESTDEGIGRDYAMAFLDEVNWQEIAEHYQEEV